MDDEHRQSLRRTAIGLLFDDLKVRVENIGMFLKEKKAYEDEEAYQIYQRDITVVISTLTLLQLEDLEQLQRR